MRYAGVGVAGRSFVLLLIAFLVGLEASTLRRFTLARRGWRNIGLVSGTNIAVWFWLYRYLQEPGTGSVGSTSRVENRTVTRSDDCSGALAT